MADVKLIGVNELRVKLKKNADLGAVKKIVKHNGAELQKKSMQNAPVDTGNLKRSIALRMADKGLTAECAATADYAGYVEWGTRFQEPQLYMGDALAKQGEKFKNDMDRLVK